MTEVQVHYFATLREQRGLGSEAVAIEPGESVGALYARLFPETAAGRMPVLFAVAQTYVPAEHPLQGGEEVAFIPPLGGG